MFDPLCTRLLAGLVLLGFALPAPAVLLADSIDDFSGTQGLANWSYGYFDQGQVGGEPHGYTAAAFVPFAAFDAGVWSATDAQVGANNHEFLSLNANGGHPTGLGPGTQSRIIWAVRRYQSPVDGLIDLSVDLRKVNVVNPQGGGITGRIFVDGTEVFSQFVANTDASGFQPLLTKAVAAGSRIDFAIDPTGSIPASGSDSIYSARADGSHFSVRISAHAVPEAATSVLMALGLGALAGIGARRRT